MVFGYLPKRLAFLRRVVGRALGNPQHASQVSQSRGPASADARPIGPQVSPIAWASRAPGRPRVYRSDIALADAGLDGGSSRAGAPRVVKTEHRRGLCSGTRGRQRRTKQYRPSVGVEVAHRAQVGIAVPGGRGALWSIRGGALEAQRDGPARRHAAKAAPADPCARRSQQGSY